MLSAANKPFMLNVIMLNVVMLDVVAPVTQPVLSTILLALRVKNSFKHIWEQSTLLTAKAHIYTLYIFMTDDLVMD